MYPEIEIEAKLYICTQVVKKECDFSIKSLAQFINKMYVQDTQDSVQADAKLIRSEESVRLDLFRWGFHWGQNNNRPYFEGSDLVIKMLNFSAYTIPTDV